MAHYEVVNTTAEHVAQLAVTMCDEDVNECWAAGHLSPQEALEMSVAMSRDTLTGMADGKVVCIFGVGQWSALAFAGSPWFLGTAELPKHAKVFLRGSQHWFEEIKKMYPYLENYVDIRHHRAIRWLKWLGFQVDAPIPHGPDRMPFHKFSWGTP
jgi:hypothetical protein